MRVAIYARVSTDNKGQDPENQLFQLREFCERQKWAIAEEYVDYVTGETDKRPRFQALLAAAGRRKFDLVLFWALDRFSREGVLPTLKHLERLTAAGCGWKSYTEQFLDTMGPFSDAILAFLACIAKQENVRRSERTKAGLDRARRAGKVLGRPERVWPRDRAVKMRAEGYSWQEVSKALDVPVGTVRAALARLRGGA